MELIKIDDLDDVDGLTICRASLLKWIEAHPNHSRQQVTYLEQMFDIIDVAPGKVSGSHRGTENHHVKSKCVGGLDVPENIKNLSKFDHLRVHLLLAQAFPSVPKLVHAAKRMNDKLMKEEASRAAIAHMTADERTQFYADADDIKRQESKNQSDRMKGNQRGKVRVPPLPPPLLSLPHLSNPNTIQL